jgi:hypothetical protein
MERRVELSRSFNMKNHERTERAQEKKDQLMTDKLKKNVFYLSKWDFIRFEKEKATTDMMERLEKRQRAFNWLLLRYKNLFV